jgi:outer membrane protein assembly factor BamA
MSAGHSSSYFNLLKAIIAGWFLMAAITSCKLPVFIKKYPGQKPFVYETNINLAGKFSKDEKEDIIAGLKGQLDDSLRSRKVDKLLWQTLKSPPVYDSSNSDKSILFMRALLVSLGYFDDSITYHAQRVWPGGLDRFFLGKRQKQYRTEITFDVKPGKPWRLDTIVYNIGHPELQKLTNSTMKQAYIKKRDAFAKAPIAAELDRLTELYRNNGYLRFGRDELVGLWDTLDVSLLHPTLDPFEQLEILQRLKERHQNPTVSLEIRLRNIDSTRFTKYYNGNVTIYPDYTIDTAGLVRKVFTDTSKKITVIQYRNKFKPGIFSPNIFLPYDSVYRQRRYIRTINRLNAMGAWQSVNIDQKPRKNQDTVDFIINLTAKRRYSFSTTLEGSINQSAISGKLFGVGINGELQNRNKWRAANLANSNIRFGVEFGNTGSSQFIQTKQISASHSIYFPRAILIEKFLPENLRDNFRTILSANAANTERRLLFNLTTVNGSWGYEYQRTRQLLRRSLLLNVKFPNIEYSFLDKKDSLDKLIAANPSLKNIFTDGLVFSVISNLTLSGGRDNNHLNVFHANFEAAPLIAGWFHNAFLDSQIYRFIKIDAQIARLIRYRKSSVALRFFAGVGIADPFNNTVNPNKTSTLPFFKQYFSGGPNSMRAWQLRRLGPGSTVKDFVGQNGTPDRYGDVQLEANAEYRFPIFKPLGIPVDGALFTDIGNVWLLKSKAGTPEQVFDISRLGKDIAIGAGAGARINFGFFVLRLDYSYKVKDPSPSVVDQDKQNKWFAYKFIKGSQFQLGIGYPFIF